MGKNEDMLQDLTRIVELTEPKYIVSLDIEGAPRDTTQVSLVDGDEKSLFNTYCTGRRLSDGKKSALVIPLKKAKILIGFNIESDLTALAKQGIVISMDVIIGDIPSKLYWKKESSLRINYQSRICRQSLNIMALKI